MNTEFNRSKWYDYEEYASGGCCAFLRNAVDDEYEDYSDYDDTEPSWHKFMKYGEDTYSIPAIPTVPKMKNLGWVNDWSPRVWTDNQGNPIILPDSKGDTTPEEYKECRKLGHSTKMFTNHTRCYTKEFCEVCGIYWEIDSSD